MPSSSIVTTTFLPVKPLFHAPMMFMSDWQLWTSSLQCWRDDSRNKTKPKKQGESRIQRDDFFPPDFNDFKDKGKHESRLYLCWKTFVWHFNNRRMFLFLHQPENIKVQRVLTSSSKKKILNPVVKVLGIIYYGRLMTDRPEDVQQTAHMETKGAMIWGCVQTLAISLQICVK